ncbi:mRNA N(3)-methylcytidine methyltransferase METTL8 isoform X2 [Tachysurus fulvidraco]|uniref:mRNA N(3)-methylcytidine methyltransferase METTL8 isoform X2 n=1 Tax=Tachysurus fulvidraco TaxID=1234273 RepID=UPI000F4FE5EA|nr:mRNA N(3)-methylcytidine methyltransferase METTL8 isoform X2 [Tachysurus fulvidraco]
MRGLLKMTVSAVTRGFGHVHCRCLCGRPPAPLGGRILTNPEHIFHHNMWDHVQWSPEEMEKARQKAEENSRDQIPVEEQEIRETCTELGETLHSRTDSQQEDSHILNHDLLREKQQHTDYVSALQTHKAVAFPGQHASFRILEVGCGAGNSVFPIINTIRGSDAFLYCFDFSNRAIQLVKEHPDYDPAVCHAFVHDICDDVSMFPFPQESLDVIAVVFVLSSIHPERIQRVVNRLAGYLKHGGIILFRDYGRYDLAQLRFKKGQCLSDNFYTRQDGTCVYFFMKDEIQQLFTNVGLEEVQNLEDRRLQVNRGKKVVMHRVWIQSKYRKPLNTRMLSSEIADVEANKPIHV